MVLTLCLVQFVDVMGVGVVITALPSMLADLHGSAAAATPLVTGYAMCFGGLLVLGARLGDRYGHRRLLAVGLALFGLGGLVGAVAPALVWLVAARCLQGAAAAVSVPNALRLLSVGAHSEAARRRAMAGWSASGAAAGATGLLVGGVLTDLAGWRLIFWVDVPLAAALILAVRRRVPAAAGQPATGGLDLPAAALLTGAVMGVVLGCALCERAGSRPAGVLLIAAGVALAALLVRVERRAAAPLLPAPALRDGRIRLGAATAFLNTATTSSVVTLATLYLQDRRGYGPAAAGLALVPLSILGMVAGAVAAKVLDRVGPRNALVAGLGAIGVADLALAALPASGATVPVCAALLGFGLGLSAVASTSIGTGVPPALSATAAGLLNTAAQVGTALGVAVLVLLSTGTGAGPRLGWSVAGALAVTAAASIRMRTRPQAAGKPGAPDRVAR